MLPFPAALAYGDPTTDTYRGRVKEATDRDVVLAFAEASMAAVVDTDLNVAVRWEALRDEVLTRMAA
jgi:hypothetical protein